MRPPARDWRRYCAPTTLWPTRYDNIEPRIGFALRLPTAGLFNTAIPDLSPKSAQLATNRGVNGGQVQVDNRRFRISAQWKIHRHHQSELHLLPGMEPRIRLPVGK